MPRSSYPPQPRRKITTTSMDSTASTSSTSSLTSPSYAGAPTSYFPPVSPTTSCASSTTSPVSPTERSFFGAITQSIRERSRSRSRGRRSRSRSPLTVPGAASTPSGPSSPPIKTGNSSRPSSSKTVPSSSDRTAAAQRKSHGRVSSYGSQTSHNGTMAVAQCGRHSNDWLFGGFSVTGTVKNLIGERRDGA